MVRIDLITGLLGSGKTTFIRLYAKYLLGKGGRIAILENDYGAINIDMLALKSLEGDNCDLEMVLGGNDYACHRRRLKSKLITLSMLGYDRIIMEPSGVFDPDELTDILSEDPLDRMYEIGSILTIVDTGLDPDQSEESDYLLVSQAADAGALIFSKSQSYPKERIGEDIAHLDRALKHFRSDRTFSDQDLILTKPWDDLTDDDFKQISKAGYALHDHIRLPVRKDNHYDSLFFMNVDLPAEDLPARVKALFSDEKAGRVIRVKGYLRRKDGTFVSVNATKDGIETSPAKDGQEVLIVIGEDLKKERIRTYWDFQYGSGHEGIFYRGAREENMV